MSNDMYKVSILFLANNHSMMTAMCCLLSSNL